MSIPDPERINKPALFPSGQIVATPRSIEVLAQVNINPTTLLDRHFTGDWGDLDDDDKRENDFSVDKELRILSAYTLPSGEKVWIITESDRSATTILLPDEY